MSNVETTTQILKLFIFVLFTFYFFTFLSPVYAAACDPKNPNPIDCGAGLQQIEDTFSRFISVSVGIAFVALLVMVVFAGFKYLTSAGEPKAVSSAHQTLLWALLGVFFLIAAWLALQLINALTGVDVLHFNAKTLL